MKGYRCIILFVVFLAYAKCFYKLPKTGRQTKMSMSETDFEKLMLSDSPKEFKGEFFRLFMKCFKKDFEMEIQILKKDMEIQILKKDFEIQILKKDLEIQKLNSTHQLEMTIQKLNSMKEMEIQKLNSAHQLEMTIAAHDSIVSQSACTSRGISE